MGALSLFSFILASQLSPKWYGPTTTTFDLVTTGSPYDPEINDVRVRFKLKGKTIERLAYWNGKSWSVTLLAEEPGSYTAEVWRNATKERTLKGTVQVSMKSATDFVRVSADHRSYVKENGARYWPMGHNLGWRGGADLPSVPDSLRRMAANGMNWARIWSCHWDGKNPWWGGRGEKIGELDQASLALWDDITSTASATGVRFQWVLFHHGPFSKSVDPNWNDNPWSRANGGWLATPEEFFTDPRAEKLSRAYLRYVVARYGHETGILAWELFNEVENTEAGRTDKWSIIESWHDRMATYLRTIDPYRHPVLTSSTLRPKLYAEADVYQPHGYPPNISGLILGAKVLTDKPFYFGEVGLGFSNPSKAQQREAIRDAIWSGYLGGHSGAGQYWYWDVVQRENLDDEYAFASKVIREASLRPGPEIRPVRVRVDAPSAGDLVLRPGVGWGPSTQRSFDLPRDANPGATGKMSTFVQGSGHADMGSEFTFNVDLAKASRLVFRVGSAAKMGAKLRVLVDGKVAVEEDFPAGSGDTQINKDYKVDLPAGKHKVVVGNVGTDWFTVDRYTFEGLGVAVDGIGAIDAGKAVVRLKANVDQATFSLDAEPVSARLADLENKRIMDFPYTVKAGRMVPSMPLPSRDCLLIMRLK